MEFKSPKTTFAETLRFTPYAWAKLLYMRDKGRTEVAGYAITATEDPLLVTDLGLVKQECTSVTFDLDVKDVADFQDKMMDEGIAPWACSNILWHTHPGDCPNPSKTDEDNFKAAFNHPHWAIMFIIAEGGKTYCRMKMNVGPGIIKLLKVEVDWNVDFEGPDRDSWDQEYKENVSEIHYVQSWGKKGNKSKSHHNRTSAYFGDPLWKRNDEEDLLDKLSDFERDYDNDHDEYSRLIDEIEEREARLIELESGLEDTTEEDIEDCYWQDNILYWWDDEENLYYSYDPAEDQWRKQMPDSDEESEWPLVGPPDFSSQAMEIVAEEWPVEDVSKKSEVVDTPF